MNKIHDIFKCLLFGTCNKAFLELDHVPKQHSCWEKHNESTFLGVLGALYRGENCVILNGSLWCLYKYFSQLNLCEAWWKSASHNSNLPSDTLRNWFHA